MTQPTVGVYVHIPFCVKKCGYCDFNAYSGYRDATKARYVDALCREIEGRSEARTRVATVFFGGGTPTTLAAGDLARVLDTVRRSFAVDPEAEISLEANPSDATLAYLSCLRGSGFNRISFGVQTFDDRLLKTIDRVHNAEDARQAVALAKQAGFDNLSIDLMFGLPRQTLADWDRSLEAAFALVVPHLSMYGLIVEEGTAFWARRERGKLSLPSEKTEAAMFGHALERAAAAGYHRYEVSNYALPGFESRHNQIYWRNEDYFGFGAGAASYRGGIRSMNERLPGRYADTVAEHGTATVEREALTPEEAMGETMMVGLRLAEGIDLLAFERRFGVRAEDRYAPQIADLRQAGLLEQSSDRLSLTQRGLFLASEVMIRFLA
ncbi:MAG: radical SAM family heme chaperone HemW [Cytophagales bacterium]|nr:radical SAM family heme chaperone HemW [Armatimonadota bacterium]